MRIEDVYKFDINFYAFLLLGLLLFIIYIKKYVVDYHRTLFKRMIIINMAMLVIEVLAWVFDGIVSPEAFFLNYAFNWLLIFLEPVMASMWVSYVDYKINESRKRLKKRLYYLHASILGFVILIVNIFYPVAFEIDSNNVYHRGSLLWIILVYVFAMIVYSVIISFKNRQVLTGSMLVGISLFALIPVVSSLVQMLVYGVILHWALAALGIVFAYLLLETISNSKDYLTLLQTRSKSDEYIKSKIEMEHTFGVIMIDLDNFKVMNDEYGHKNGDNILFHFSKILIDTFSESGFVARYGGDEFIITFDQSVRKTDLMYKQEIKERILSYDKFDLLSQLKFSFGSTYYKPEEPQTMDELMFEVDRLMYLDKGKNLTRRTSDK